MKPEDYLDRHLPELYDAFLMAIREDFLKPKDKLDCFVTFKANRKLIEELRRNGVNVSAVCRAALEKIRKTVRSKKR